MKFWPLAPPSRIPDKDNMQLAAIILAGGRSTRMGRPKESLPFAGQSLLARTCQTLAACASPIVVVARDAQQELPAVPPTVHRTHDAVLDQGPLVGLAAGMQWLLTHGGLTEADATFATACDHPFLTAHAVRALAGELGADDIVMPRAAGCMQPLCAIYRLSVLATIGRLQLAGITSPRSLASAARVRILDEAHLRQIDPELRFLRSIDTPDDYDAARHELR